MKYTALTQNNGGLGICDLLLFLGLSDKYVGFYYTADAVRLVMERPERMFLITKDVYMETAEIYGTTWNAVERGIRFTINKLWRTEPEYFLRKLKLPLHEKPTPAKFIAMLSMYCATFLEN